MLVDNKKSEKDRSRPEENIFLKVKTAANFYEANVLTSITLQELADKIISVKKLEVENEYAFYQNRKKIEDMTKPISSYGFSDGEQLTLGAPGSGVQ